MQLLGTVISTSNLIDSVSADYHKEWVVMIHGGPQVASLLAAQSGYKYHGPVNSSINFIISIVYIRLFLSIIS